MAVRPECAWILEFGPRGYSLWTLTCYQLRSLVSLVSEIVCVCVCGVIVLWLLHSDSLVWRAGVCVYDWFIVCVYVFVCACGCTQVYVGVCMSVNQWPCLHLVLTSVSVIRSQVVSRKYRCYGVQNVLFYFINMQEHLCDWVMALEILPRQNLKSRVTDAFTMHVTVRSKVK